MTQDEIDEITKVDPVVPYPVRIAELEAQVETLQTENVDLMLALVETDERAEQNNVDTKNALGAVEEKAKQANVDTMLALAELSVLIEELAAATPEA